MILPLGVKTGPLDRFLASLEASVGALEQASGRHFRGYECKTTKLVSASEKTLYLSLFWITQSSFL